MQRRYDHIDLRVPRLADVRSFYESLLPALGFTRNVQVDGWLQFEAAGQDITEFFGVTESPGHVANENRIAFWTATRDDLPRLAEIAKAAGARNLEGPMEYEPGYHAIFFDDPCGNRLEVCHRIRIQPPTIHEACRLHDHQIDHHLPRRTDCRGQPRSYRCLEP